MDQLGRYGSLRLNRAWKSCERQSKSEAFWFLSSWCLAEIATKWWQGYDV
jgi:hypothetical protein